MLHGLLAKELSSYFNLAIRDHYKDKNNWDIKVGYKQNSLRIWQKIAEISGGYKYKYSKIGTLGAIAIGIFLGLLFYMIYADQMMGFLMVPILMIGCYLVFMAAVMQ